MRPIIGRQYSNQSTRGGLRRARRQRRVANEARTLVLGHVVELALQSAAICRMSGLAATVRS